jgi:hypothetical protein
LARSSLAVDIRGQPLDRDQLAAELVERQILDQVDSGLGEDMLMPR